MPHDKSYQHAVARSFKISPVLLTEILRSTVHRLIEQAMVAKLATLRIVPAGRRKTAWGGLFGTVICRNAKC
ncbi:hypothetical protein [Paracoccus liaowanqingii]|uniref:hypothetical protein n=1 Tax=Paracoccus liaowanqingii TaxID=2560053 RepID=UPI00159BEB03|nr:hypothetical protein [Paracoccus liaowanqingii]